MEIKKGIETDGYGNYLYQGIDPDKVRPVCLACGDPVKMVYHSGGIPKYAQHCRECYTELRWGKIPRASRHRKAI